MIEHRNVVKLLFSDKMQFKERRKRNPFPELPARTILYNIVGDTLN